MTYQSHYEVHLESRALEGGSAEEMDAVVGELNALGLPDYRPSPLYKAWVQGATVPCADCGQSFAPTGIPALSTEARCAACAS